MRSIIEISKPAIQSNFEFFRKITGTSLVTPILKSNAYGHGLEKVFTILMPLLPKSIGVNYLFEAQELRALGYQGRIIILGPIEHREIKSAYEGQIEISIGDIDLLNFWIEQKSRPQAHIKLDTGMTRRGFFLNQIEDLLPRIYPYISDVIGLYSHFADVEDVIELDFAMQQVMEFNQVVSLLSKKGIYLENHMASSASILLLKDSHLHLCRLGISLYGQWPSKRTKHAFKKTSGMKSELKPALSWRSEIAETKRVKQGTYIGYGRTFQAQQDMKIGVIPVGYFEGYPRLAGETHEAYVLLKGQKCPIVGRICMNMLMIDISHLPLARQGDTVTLIGKDQHAYLDASKLASWAQTIDYELLTRLNPRIPRIIKE